MLPGVAAANPESQPVSEDAQLPGTTRAAARTAVTTQFARRSGRAASQKQSQQVQEEEEEEEEDEGEEDEGEEQEEGDEGGEEEQEEEGVQFAPEVSQGGVSTQVSEPPPRAMRRRRI